ncbi:MAG: hypothetical protein OEV49_03780 [candidate division Zixibacteria bacterium]|nr:hypothetical protein [candidate division Zixibacteria bacterium]MDH3936831.1 hypothetical protein [candidate division Zixibacteria bacterium]MDH4033342.1 hypothetical protein [candidate division Zixibacteria bacterium]
MSMTPEWLTILTGVLVLIVGFIFHWLGQLISVVNWGLATRMGLQEQVMLPEHKVYEHGTAVADVLIGWTYGLAGVGLLLGAQWAFRLTWIPGAVLVYHGLNAWFWEANRRKSGHQFFSNSLRVGWCSANIITGGLSLFVAWHNC